MSSSLDLGLWKTWLCGVVTRVVYSENGFEVCNAQKKMASHKVEDLVAYGCSTLGLFSPFDVIRIVGNSKNWSFDP
jgi:hypothetical protein